MPRGGRSLNRVPFFPNEFRLEWPHARRLESGSVYPKGHSFLEDNWVLRVHVVDLLEQSMNHIKKERLTSIRLGVLRENKISDLLQHRIRERVLLGPRGRRGQKVRN